jgi:putative spermidine/putrescine transport system substrate-binding protein
LPKGQGTIHATNKLNEGNKSMKKSMLNILKRGTCALALVVAFGAQSHAQSSTLYLGWQGGSRENLMKEKILPRFEAEHGVKVEYVAGVSTELLARLQAQRSNQELDVVMLDDGPMYQAVEFGLCDHLESNPIYKDMTPAAVMSGAEQYAVGIGFVALGLVYNTATFEKNGWPAPTSWNDLDRPEFQGQAVIMSISNTFGLGALVTYAKLAGGDEKNIEPGFKHIIERIKPNVLAFVPTSGQLSSLFQNGEVAIAAWSNDRANALKESGFPAGFVFPKEGAVATLVGACPVKKQEANPLAQEFVRFLLSPEIQAILAQGAQLSPANKNTNIPKELAEKLASEERHQLTKIDWSVVNPQRADWTRRWSREVER